MRNIAFALPALLVAALALSPAAEAARPVHHRMVTASHAAIPQNGNIEHLNDLSLQRARNGQNTAQPLAPALNQ